SDRDWSSDVCSSDLNGATFADYTKPTRLRDRYRRAPRRADGVSAPGAGLSESSDNGLDWLDVPNVRIGNVLRRAGIGRLTRQYKDRKSTRLNSSHDQ